MSAKGMHDATYVPTATSLMLGIYPNPSNGPTRISINLPVAEMVSVSIYNSAGQVVYALSGDVYPQGVQVIHWDGKSNTGEDVRPGYYFIEGLCRKLNICR